MIWILWNFSSSSVCCCCTISICPRILDGQLLAAHLERMRWALGGGWSQMKSWGGLARQGHPGRGGEWGNPGGSWNQSQPSNQEVDVSWGQPLPPSGSGCGPAWLGRPSLPAVWELWWASREMLAHGAQCNDRARQGTMSEMREVMLDSPPYILRSGGASPPIRQSSGLWSALPW